jgi:hypothetical protein
MSEIKRPARDNFQSVAESEQLGPYPSWDLWKPTLLKEIGDDNFKRFDSRVQDLLHLAYVARRKTQLGVDVVGDVKEMQKLENELGGGDQVRSNPKVDHALIFVYSRTKS